MPTLTIQISANIVRFARFIVFRLKDGYILPLRRSSEKIEEMQMGDSVLQRWIASRSANQILRNMLRSIRTLIPGVHLHLFFSGA